MSRLIPAVVSKMVAAYADVAKERVFTEGTKSTVRGITAVADVLLDAVEKTIADRCYFGTGPYDRADLVSKAIMKTVRDHLFKPLTPAERVTVTDAGHDYFNIEVAGNSLLNYRAKGRVEAELIADGYRYRLEKEAANGST